MNSLYSLVPVYNLNGIMDVGLDLVFSLIMDNVAYLISSCQLLSAHLLFRPEAIIVCFLKIHLFVFARVESFVRTYFPFRLHRVISAGPNAVLCSSAKKTFFTISLEFDHLSKIRDVTD